MDPRVSGRFGPYLIESPLGEGGMGSVYRARDMRLDREVAIKILRANAPDDDQKTKGRLMREARAISSLDHPNFPILYEVGEVDDRPYMVFELLEGESLRSLLSTGPLPPIEAVRIMIQVAEGLAAAHAVGIIHRDLKPDNILITRSGQAKILDLGLSQAREEPDDAPGMVFGTVAYMSPEQTRGERLDARSDIYSFGAILYEAVAGHPPFAGPVVEVLTARLKRDPDFTVLPDDLLAIVRKCMQRRPHERYQSMREVAAELRATGSHSLSVSRLAEVAALRRELAARVAGDPAQRDINALRELERLDALQEQLELEASPQLSLDKREALRRLDKQIAKGSFLVDAEDELRWLSKNRLVIAELFLNPASAQDAYEQARARHEEVDVRIQSQIDTLQKIRRLVSRAPDSPAPPAEPAPPSELIAFAPRMSEWAFPAFVSVLVFATVAVFRGTTSHLAMQRAFSVSTLIIVALVAIIATAVFWLWPFRRHKKPPATTAKKAQETGMSRWIRQEGRENVIVFVHGVFGNEVSTWTNEKKGLYWPEMMCGDPAFDDADVYVHGFPSPYLGAAYNIEELAARMLTFLEEDGIFSTRRRVFFLCHSMGGLVTRACLLQKKIHPELVPLIFFYCTPTTGSDIAAVGQALSRQPQLKFMLPMDTGQFVDSLQRAWLQTNDDKERSYVVRIDSYTAYELLPTFGIQIVSKQSATNLSTRAPLALDRNHIDAVKPRSLRDDPYVYFRRAYLRTKEQAASVTPAPPATPDAKVTTEEQRQAADRMSVLFNAHVLGVETMAERYANDLTTRSLLEEVMNDYDASYTAIRQQREVHQANTTRLFGAAASAHYDEIVRLIRETHALVIRLMPEAAAVLSGEKAYADPPTVKPIAEELFTCAATLAGHVATFLAALRAASMRVA